MKYDSFKTPDPLFHGTDFWMLNGDLRDEQIEFQMKEMHDKGVYTFIARTYLGLRSDYPGPRFKKSLKKIIETAKALGMKLFLQAGYMPEAVPNLPEEGALRYIYPVREGEEEGRRILCKKNGISFVEQSSHTFLDMFDPTSMEHYLKTCYEDMWKEFSEEYGKTILSIWVDEPSYNGAYLPFTGKLEVLFFERWGYSFADKAWMLYFDGEGAESLRYHYRVLMRDLLEVNYFAKVRDWCRAHDLLFSGHLMMEDTLCMQIRRAQACMPYYRYFDIPGIDILRGRMPFADSPVVDLDPTERQNTLYTTALQCTSAARQAGKTHILAEMYGVSGEGFGFREMAAMFDSYAAMGINHRSVHGIFYTLHGRGKRAYPPHVSYYQPYWEKYGRMTDYCARVSAFISEGAGAADIAILHPLETAYTLYRGAIDEPKEQSSGGTELARLDGAFYDLIKAAKSAQHEIEFADLASIRDMGRAENGELVVGAAHYKTVILPYLSVITEDCLALLEKIAEGGGKILCLGDAPTMIDGFADASAAARIEKISQRAETLSELLSLLDAPKVSIEGNGAANILVNRRILANGEHLFLYNSDHTRPARITLTLTANALFRYDAFNAEISPFPFKKTENGIRAEISLPPAGSILLSTAQNEPTTADVNESAPALSLPLGGAWKTEAEDENAYLLEFCRYKKGDGDFSKPLPIMAIHRLLTAEEYRGELTLRYELQTIDDIGCVSLALEDPSEQEIYLNGKRIPSSSCGYFRDYTFEKVPLGDLFAGKHILEIKRTFSPLTRVTNPLTQLFETRHGVELEPMYLLGRFSVHGHRTASQSGSMTFARDFTLCKKEPAASMGELTQEGYPFFVGKIALTKCFTVPKGLDLSRAHFSIGTLNAACAEILLNGKAIGDLYRAPAVLSLGSALREGKNEITIRLFTTLHNVIGPFHRPLGNIGNTFGGGYKNPDAAWLSVDTTKEDWEMHMEDFYPNWTDEYNVAPLGIRDAAIVIPLH